MIILFIICINTFILTEELQYGVKIRNIKAGSAVLKFDNLYDSKNNLGKISFNVKTNKIIDFFYKLRDNITMIVNLDNYSITEIQKNIQQGKYKKLNQAVIDYKNKTIFYNSKEQHFDNILYSPISIIYYLRKQNLNINKKFHFDIFENGKIKNVIAEVQNFESIKIKNKIYNCFVLTIKSIKDNHINKEMTLMIDSSGKHLPIIIKTKTKQGEMILSFKKTISNEK